MTMIAESTPAAAAPAWEAPTNYRFEIPPFPNGWFQVAYSDEVADGDVVPLQYFGKDLVLFRGQDGVPRVLDAFCPHLGAHLGYGGRVEDNCIRCPFHAWRFDGAGKCVDVPYANDEERKIAEEEAKIRAQREAIERTERELQRLSSTGLAKVSVESYRLRIADIAALAERDAKSQEFERLYKEKVQARDWYAARDVVLDFERTVPDSPRPTLLFNGYAEQVASLYAGMDLRKNY